MDLETSLLEPPYLNWLIFWQQPWHDMDPSWVVDLPNSHQHPWEHIAPEVIRHYLGLDSAFPCMPENVLLQWLAMGKGKRVASLYLMGEVILRGSGKQHLHDDDIFWCRHLAKALMPGSWSVAKTRGLTAEQMGLIVMRQWMAHSTWQRARLLYPKPLFESIEAVISDPIPEQRLNQLWHSVIWRLTEMSRPDTSQQDNRE